MDYSQLKSAKDHFEAYADLSSGQGFGIPATGKKMMQQHADYMKKNLDASSQRAAYNKIKSHANALYVNDEISDSDRNFVHKTYAPSTVKEDTEMKLDEKEMTGSEMKKREEIAKSMKKGFAGFKKRYGERAKEVMYATATKQAMKSEEVESVAEGAPELLKAEMPLVRHIEKELAQHGYEKGTPEYDQMFKHSIAMYRKFGNVDAIKKGVSEDQHYCAKHVLSNVFGEGVVLEGQHAEPDENGHVEWYTVQFEHGEEVIFAEDVEIMMAEFHNNHNPAPAKKQKAKK